MVFVYWSCYLLFYGFYIYLLLLSIVNSYICNSGYVLF